MYTRQARSVVARPQTVEVAITFTAEELERLEALASQSGSDISGFVQNAALEAAHIKRSNQRERNGSVDTGWLSESFQAAPENASEAKEGVLVQTANATKAAAAVETENEKSTTTSPKKGVTGEQLSLAKGSGPVWEIRKALGRERLHGLGWTREHLAFVLKLSVVGVRKLEREGTAPVKSKVAREKLLELAKAIKEPNEVVKRFIEESGK